VNVYCAVPIRGVKAENTLASLIPSIVNDLSYNAFSELSIPSPHLLSDNEIFERDMQWLKESECLIAEVSSASTGVGFEIAYALYVLKIPVLALYHQPGSASVSAMINGCSSSLLTKRSYSEAGDLKTQISDFLNFIWKSIEREGIY
jgi:2'-deoxynucleoside 5'-phosphate N-hydrolase